MDLTDLDANARPVDTMMIGPVDAVLPEESRMSAGGVYGKVRRVVRIEGFIAREHR